MRNILVFIKIICLAFVCFLAPVFKGHSQTCYAHLALPKNATGSLIDQALPALNVASCDLVSTMPSEYGSVFKVYGTGIYHLGQFYGPDDNQDASYYQLLDMARANSS